MMEKQNLLSEIEELTEKRDRLLAQVREAEQWESAAWDSFQALSDHLKAVEKKREIAQNFWDSSQRDIQYQIEFIANQSERVKKILAEKRYDLLEDEIAKLMKEVSGLAEVLGLEIDELPKHFPFFDLPAQEPKGE